jgi:hypothetical protein
MKKIGEEWALDWYTTKGGRTISKPKFGESLKLRDLLGVKTAPKKKIVPKTKVSLGDFLRKEYDTTFIECSAGVVTLRYVCNINKVKKMFPTAKSVYFWSRERDIFSNIYNV